MSKQITNDDILRVAARLFKSKGVAGTTIRAIAEEADVLPGSITYRYPTKEALVVAMMERGIEHVIGVVLEAIKDSRDPIERLRLAARAHLRVLLSGEAAVHVLLFEWERLSGTTREAVVRLRNRYDSIWDGLVFEAVGGGQIVAGLDLSLLRLFAFGALNSAAQWYRPDGPRTPEEIADAFGAFISLGVLSEDRRPSQIMEAYARNHALDTRRGSDAGAKRHDDEEL